MKTITGNEWRVASDMWRMAETDHGLRTTDHGPLTPHPAVPPVPQALPRHYPSPATRHPPRSAFTLVEMLVVVSVMAILATLMFPALRAVKENQIRTRARGELIQLETAIHAYQSKFGHYPPDSGHPYVVNQLYYELLGTTNSSGVYHTLDESAQTIAAGAVSTVFGPSVSGFINCSREGGGDEAPTAMNFLKGLKPSQHLATTRGCTVLGMQLEGPPADMLQDAAGRKINPWRYNSSNPTNNPKSFDLWIDVKVGKKTNRICNWSEKPLVVGP